MYACLVLLLPWFIVFLGVIGLGMLLFVVIDPPDHTGSANAAWLTAMVVLLLVPVLAAYLWSELTVASADEQAIPLLVIMAAAAFTGGCAGGLVYYIQRLHS